MSEGEILSRQTPRSKVDGSAGASTQLLAFKRATRSNLEKVRSSETQSMDVFAAAAGRTLSRYGRRLCKLHQCWGV